MHQDAPHPETRRPPRIVTRTGDPTKPVLRSLAAQMPNTIRTKAAEPHMLEAIMPLGDHLEDLRRRIILGLGGAIPIFILALVFARDLIALLIQPVRTALLNADQTPVMLATNFIETFSIYMHVALVATVLVASPWLLYHLWMFVRPGLYRSERRFVYVLIPLSTILMIGGVLFLYTTILPVVLDFFVRFGAGIGAQEAPVAPLPDGATLPTMPVLAADPADPAPGQMWVLDQLRQLRVAVAAADGSVHVLGVPLTASTGIEQQYRISEYIRTFLNMTLGFAIGFQTPVVVLLLGWSGIIDRSLLRTYRKQVIMVCAIASAFLTPADPWSMILLAIPLYGLFELGGLLLWLLPAERVAGPREADGAPDE